MQELRLEIRLLSDTLTIDGDNPSNPDDPRGFAFTKQTNTPSEAHLSSPSEEVEAIVKAYGEQVAALTQKLNDDLHRQLSLNRDGEINFPRKVLNMK